MNPMGPCVMCGCTGYELSMGGPSICPSCDCGLTAPYVLQKNIQRLSTALEVERARVASLREALEAVYKSWMWDTGDADRPGYADTFDERGKETAQLVVKALA